MEAVSMEGARNGVEGWFDFPSTEDPYAKVTSIPTARSVSSLAAQFPCIKSLRYCFIPAVFSGIFGRGRFSRR